MARLLAHSQQGNGELSPTARRSQILPVTRKGWNCKGRNQDHERLCGETPDRPGRDALAAGRGRREGRNVTSALENPDGETQVSPVSPAGVRVGMMQGQEKGLEWGPQNLLEMG